MNRPELEALAYDEALRLMEVYFTHVHPYTCWIDIPADVSYNEVDFFCRLVEDELLLKGEKITRNGKFFKINRFQHNK